MKKTDANRNIGFSQNNFWFYFYFTDPKDQPFSF